MHQLTRRHVIATLTSSTVLLCPAILNAQTTTLELDDWADIPDDTPIGQSQTISVDAGTSEIEISALKPGEVAVIARPTTDEKYTATGMIQYIAVHHRTEDQITAADDRDGTIQDPAYFVVNLLCTHKGKAIGITGNPEAPFACTDRGSRHSSVYNVSGFGVSGASEDEYLSIPDYTLSVGDSVVLTLT
ncbi:hypothetical protein MWU61_18655 [Loktanella sp. F6476L]|uniref:hypothetical protein n=1 Tax=Loktanella sp. F6476L TaxID=2926405 RepID=UPI001FF570A9|nr:hypothetical protein [Loktanella sp. F6476L]MCK0122579.1 hypothetical protein [Loktanella sp. F6476L]